MVAERPTITNIISTIWCRLKGERIRCRKIPYAFTDQAASKAVVTETPYRGRLRLAFGTPLVAWTPLLTGPGHWGGVQLAFVSH